MFTIKGKNYQEIEIKSSKFLSYAFSVNSVEQINDILIDIRQKHEKATHVCYGYVCNSLEKFSDDGEPSGTAGKPILDTIKKQNLSNVLVVVVRYFGGIKLGAGGLVRAYTKGATEVLKLAEVVNLKPYKQYVLNMPYDKFELVKNELQKLNTSILNTNYLENVEIEVAVESSFNSEFENIMKNYKVTYNFIKEQYL